MTYHPFSQYGIPEPPEGAVFGYLFIPDRGKGAPHATFEYWRDAESCIWKAPIPPEIADKVMACEIPPDWAGLLKAWHFVLEDKP